MQPMRHGTTSFTSSCDSIHRRRLGSGLRLLCERPPPPHPATIPTDSLHAPCPALPMAATRNHYFLPLTRPLTMAFAFVLVFNGAASTSRKLRQERHVYSHANPRLSQAP